MVNVKPIIEATDDVLIATRRLAYLEGALDVLQEEEARLASTHATLLRAFGNKP